ncbi:DUF4097 family beta strand repeat-containing protein [Clostridium amazonitimonense]|uniref:DUF4097 family beta strand repeat-containing protein n=1 Tax=Clostridium amazonitimonense TaxID=1499689 RepID=UPI000509D452|nr:DUF4097 family beta strand repeat-containing protein [Clostridium amazonitimonense]
MFKNNKFIKKATLYLLCTVFVCYGIAGMIINSSGFSFYNLFKDFHSNVNINVGGHWSDFIYKYSYEVDEEKSIDISSTNNIKIDTVSADIRILISDDHNVKATLKGYIKSSQEVSTPKLDMTEQKDTIYIRSQGKSFIGPSSYSENLTLEVFIPESYVNNLYIKSTSSDVTIETLNLNSFNINTTSGTINAGEITVKNFDFGSTSGDLKIDKLKSDNNQIKTTSGNIKVDSMEGKLSLKSTSGDSYLYYRDMPSGEININAISGKVELLTPSNAEFFINSSSTSGNIALNKPIILEVKKEHQIKGVVGSDKCKVNIKTTSGDIRIK